MKRRKKNSKQKKDDGLKYFREFLKAVNGYSIAATGKGINNFDYLMSDEYEKKVCGK